MLKDQPVIKQVTSVFVLDNTEIGLIHRFGYEIHFEIHPQYQKLFATKFRTSGQAYLEELLKEPMVTTRVNFDQRVSLKLVPRLGFVETHRDADSVYYTLEKAPFKRKHNDS